MILKDVKYFTKLIYEEMPNNSVVWGKPHLSWRSCLDLCSCIKRTCHHECALHCCFLVIYCVPSIVACLGRSRSWSAFKVLRRISATFAATRQDVFRLLCAYLLTYVFPPNIFTHNIAFDSKVFWAKLEYPTSCINTLYHYLLPYLLSLGLLWWPA